MKLTQDQVDELIKAHNLKATLEKRCCDLSTEEVSRLTQIIQEIQEIQPHLIRQFLGDDQ